MQIRGGGAHKFTCTLEEKMNILYNNYCAKYVVFSEIEAKVVAQYPECYGLHACMCVRVMVS